MSWRNFFEVMSPWSFTIFRTCSGGISSFGASTYPCLRRWPYRRELSVCHLRAAKEEEKGEVRVGRAIFSRGVRRTSLAEVGHGVSDSGDLARAWQTYRVAG